MCDERGQIKEAIDYYDRALGIAPNPNLRILAATIMPAIYQSTDEIDFWRKRVNAQLERCHADGVTCDLTSFPGTVLFYLAYQGQNDRDLQRSFARLHRVPATQQPVPMLDRANRKLRVGFLSRHLNEHTIGRLFHQAILRLNREAFEVVVFSLGQFEDTIADALRNGVTQYVELPCELGAARLAILDRRLDVLVYTDIGMEPWSGALRAIPARAGAMLHLGPPGHQRHRNG